MTEAAVHLPRHPLVLSLLLVLLPVLLRYSARIDDLSPLRGPLTERIRALSTVSTANDTLDRGFLSGVSGEARELLLQWMEEAGLVGTVDGVGNVIGSVACGDAAARTGRGVVVMGSHYDTVSGAGAWDGVYGVVSALGVVEVLAQRAGGLCALPFDVEVVAFEDEEGNGDYGTVNLGARAYSGLVNVQRDIGDAERLVKRLEAEFGAEGEGGYLERLERRLERVRVDPTRILAFLELHIEQGPVLENRGAPVGAVGAIAGQTRIVVDFEGRQGHAGTAPMLTRRDALTAAAEAVGIVEQAGRAKAHLGLVATVGSLRIAPGSSNVIPGHVVMSVDVRAPVDDVRTAAVRAILALIDRIAAARQVAATAEIKHEVPAVAMTPWLRSVVERVVTSHAASDVARADVIARESIASEDSAQPPPAPSGTLVSGAGHDTQFMAAISDVAMLFVRCRGGVSHHPDEYVSDRDSFAGAKALLDVVDGIAEQVRRKPSMMAIPS